MPANTRGADKPEWMWELDDSLFDRLEGMEALAGELGVSPARYALAWTLAQPAMRSLVVGVTRESQIQDALASLDVTLPPEHFDKLDEICPPPWSQPDPIRGGS